MTLKEAIEHSLEISEDESKCSECRKDHLQLAVWLAELQSRRLDEALRKKNQHDETIENLRALAER